MGRENDPNYRELEPPVTPEEALSKYGRESDWPDDVTIKPRDDWTWAERRAELYDMLERAGHRAALPSLRALGDRYDVSHTTIRKDLDAIAEWEAVHLGADVEVELSLLQRSAVRDYLREARKLRKEGKNDEAADMKAAAYRLASSHLSDLQSTGTVDHAAMKQEVALEGELDSTRTIEVDDEDRELALELVRARQERDAGGDGDDVDDGGDEADD